jgi:hypothetical protein
MIATTSRQTSAGGWYKSRSNQLSWLHQLSFLDGGERYAASLGYFYFLGSEGDDLFTPEFREKLDWANPIAPSAAYERHCRQLSIACFTPIACSADHPVMILTE